MSWGTELWDQFDSISYHTNKGIDFLDKYGSFVKERCAIEVEYASKLRRLVKNHQYKKKDESDTQFTYIQAFIMMLQEITDLAGQHELIAENMCSEITNEICKLIKELKEDRKKFLSEGQKLNCNIQNSYIQLDKSKKYYEKAFKEAEKAHENFIRVDADLNLSRAEVEKAKQLSLSKTQLADQYKSEYATNLQRTNDLQRIHFNDSMPKVFDNLQDMEQRRIKKTQNFIFQSAKIQLDVFPIINKCLQGIIKASDLVDVKKDCDYVIERYKSGNEPPEDIPFEDLSCPSTDHNGTSIHSNHSLNYSNSITGKDTMKGTIVYAKLRKRANIFNFFGSNKQNNDELKEEIYADLPPVQRRKRIQEKLNNIQEQFKQETNVRDGLMKMRQAYLENNKLGDPSSLDSQINENSKKLEKLQLELKKYEGFLNEITLKPNTSNSGLNKPPQNGTQNNQIKNNSFSEESLSRSASDSSVSNLQQSVKNCVTNGINNHSKSTLKSNTNSSNNLNNHKFNLNGSYVVNSSPSNAGSSNYEQNGHSPEIDTHNVNKIDNMGVNLSNVDFIDGDQHEFEEEEEFEVDLISFGKAKALYAFDPQSEGAIKMSDDDVFDVVELDQGDGWTRVRRSDLEEGFVPTSYLEIELYDK